MKKPKKKKSKKFESGEYIPFDGETCMPINTEGFTPEDWKEAMNISHAMLGYKEADKHSRRVNIGIFLGMLMAGLGFLVCVWK